MSESIPVVDAAYPSPTILDSRRITGPSRYGRQPGAVLEVAAPVAPRRLEAWRARVADLTAALGWDLQLASESAGILFLAAPVDVLMTATEVNEEAWAAAEREAAVAAEVVARLRASADAESAAAPNLRAVHAEAVRRGICATFDDDLLTLGSGRGALSWLLPAIPPADLVPWDRIADVPIALVTGSNGKTTTTRLLAAMWRAAGRVPGASCTDGVVIDGESVLGGDYSGPAGARAVLRHPAVEAAILETARGGILRRGLAVTRADAAIITNIAADHFGQYGIESLEDLARAKAVVASVLEPAGVLVLNADDPTLAVLGQGMSGRTAWFSRDPSSLRVAGGPAAFVREGRVVLRVDGDHDLGAVAEMPVTLAGAATHNVENVLGAALLAALTGVPVEAIRSTLAAFGAAAADNPGRLQVREAGGVTLLVDYAHNPDGIAALCAAAAGMPASRRLVVLGQAGDRPNDQIRALVRAAWTSLGFDRVVIKEMPTLLRGRGPGDVPRLILDELRRLGVRADQMEVASGEMEALRLALGWAAEGDLLVFPSHSEQAAVLAELDRLAERGWRAGEPLPGETATGEGA